MGRRKIEMKLVKDSSSRQVTFSKRRTGVFKKANELATLCGVQIAIVAFSPGGKPFSFGQPSVHSVANKFLHHGDGDNNDDDDDVAARSKGSSTMEKLSQKLMGLMNELQVEKKKGEMLDKALKKKNLSQGKLPIELLNFNELGMLKHLMNKLKYDVSECGKQLEASLSLMLLAKKVVVKKGKCDA